MTGDSGSGEVNYWPGFVDALSNVVLTLVFVLVIFVFALIMASNKVEEKMRQVVDAQNSERVEASELLKMKEQVAQLEKELEQAKQGSMTISADKKSKDQDFGDMQQQLSSQASEAKEILVQRNEVETKEGAVDIAEQNKSKLSILFPASVYKMDAASSDNLSKALDEIQGQLETSKIIIRSVRGSETFTVAQRLAYYRALVIRNFLISKRGVDPSKIESVIVDPDSSGGGRVEVLFSNE